MEEIYLEIDRIIKHYRDPQNPYKLYREVKRFINSLILHPDEYDRYIRYVADLLSI